MEKFVNLTPHEVVVVTDKEIRIPSAGIARLQQQEKLVGEVAGIPVISTTYGELQLPEVDVAGKYVIVSQLVAQGAAEKLLARGAKAVFVPNTGPTPKGAVRDESGRIKGVHSLILVAGEL